MLLFSEDATIFKKKIAHEIMKRLPSKVAHNRPNFFSVLRWAAHMAQNWFSIL